MDPQECFNFFQAQTKIPLDKCGFRLVYRENDFDGDNCYTQEEMYDLMQLLLQKDKPKTIDQIKSMIIANLKKVGDSKKKGPVKSYTGNQAGYKAWVRDTCQHLVDLNWDRFDDDMDGFMDEDEAHNFVESLVPKSKIDKDSFDRIYKEADRDEDGNIEPPEVVEWLIMLVQKSVKTQELLKKDIHNTLKSMSIPGEVNKVKQAARLVQEENVMGWITELLNEQSKKFDEDGNGLLDEQELATMIQAFNPESELDRPYFSRKFKDFDEDGDEELNLKEMSEFFKNLVGKGAVKNKDQLKTIVNKRVSQTMVHFCGSQEEIEKCVVDMVEEMFGEYDLDNNGSLEEPECFNFFNGIIQQKAGANSALDSAEFHRWFEENKNEDSKVEKEDAVNAFINLLKGKNPHSKNQLRQMVYAALLKEVNCTVVETFSGSAEERQQWYKKSIDDWIDESWVAYDANGNGDLEMQECFDMFKELIEGKFDGQDVVDEIDIEQHKVYFSSMVNKLEDAITRDELAQNFYELLQNEELGTLTQIHMALQNNLKDKISSQKLKED